MMENETIYDHLPNVFVRLLDDDTVHTGKLVEVTEVVLVMHRSDYPENMLTYFPMRRVRQFDLEADLDDINV